MPNRDIFADQDSDNPSGRAVAVTPSDATDLGLTRGIYVGISGNLAVTMANDVDVTFVGVLGGSWLPLRVQKVKATGTTAASIVALY